VINRQNALGFAALVMISIIVVVGSTHAQKDVQITADAERIVSVDEKGDWLFVVFRDGREYAVRRAGVASVTYQPLEVARQINLPTHVQVFTAGGSQRVEFSDEKVAKQFYRELFKHAVEEREQGSKR
jgi:hypothetical protein